MQLSQITPSIFASLGLSTAFDSINCGTSPHGRELLFLIDGFGADIIEKYGSYLPKISLLQKYGSVQTSFPSTTATSLATLTTGQMPGAHGMLGYTVQVPRSGGRILNSLKWDDRVDPIMWQPVPTLFERGAAENINVTHVAAKRYEKTGFTQAVFRGAHYKGANLYSDLITETVEALTKTPAFVYLYVNELDVAGHSDGVGSEKWLQALAAIDQFVSNLLQKLPHGTRLWITADHGMINVQEKIVIGLDNNLSEEVAVIGGEPRARHLYLSSNIDSDSAQDELAARWRETLGAKAKIFSRREALSAQLFGPEVSDDARDRMGDVIAIAQDGVILIEKSRQDLEGSMVGHHGGDSEVESFVPLLTTTL